MIEVYCDGSWRQGDKYGYVGIYIPEMGLGYSQRVKATSSATTERKAVNAAIRICIDLGVKAIIYTDFLALVKGAKASGKPKCYKHLRELQKEHRFKFRYVPREENEYANRFARALLPISPTKPKAKHQGKWCKWWRSTVRLFNPKP